MNEWIPLFATTSAERKNTTTIQEKDTYTAKKEQNTRISITYSPNATKQFLSSYECWSVFFLFHYHSTWITHTHPFNGPFPGLPGWAGTRKVKPIWILLKQETVSSSGISWAICKSASRYRQITMPVPHQSFFTGWMPFLPPNQQRQSTEGTISTWINRSEKHILPNICLTCLYMYITNVHASMPAIVNGNTHTRARTRVRAHTHTHTHTHLTDLCSGLPGWTGTRKVKPIWILLKQETVSGGGISWAICKSAPRSRQITTSAPHH